MYAFYDFETTGTSTAFDQPLQFAAILTDDNFNEIETVNFRCRLSNHILPAPWALYVTGISLETLLDQSLPSVFEFSNLLQKLVLRWSPAVWIGYNSISFDEMIFRQLFYQNLQPNIYATQLNGNSRLDMLTVMYAAFTIENSSFSWPKHNSGLNSFKLDQLAPFNGFNNHNAHDALGDVRATLFLAKLVKDRCPKVWTNSLISSDKRNVNSLLSSNIPLSLISRDGSRPPRELSVVYSGRSNSDSNKVALIDLEIFLKGNIDLNQATLLSVKSLFEKSPKVIKLLRINSSPYIWNNESTRTDFFSIAKTIRKNSNFEKLVSEFLSNDQKNSNENRSVELKIYDQFLSNEDKNILETFLTQDWSNRKCQIKKLSDKRLRTLGVRLLLLEAPNELPENTKIKSFKAISRRWFDSESEQSGWMTFSKVDKQLKELVRLGHFSVEKKEKFDKFYSGRLDCLKTFLEII